ncbi:MAG: 4a-hydroxytetrahydrobiopterin dehydratase [Armatimonadota bacterium]|nr:4a-hydroxytetrahydrobiopterin dehydratase [bacterium]
MELAEQKCITFSKDTPPLNRDQAQELAKQIPNWDISEDHIERTFKFPNFVEAMKFANRITNIAEDQNHHPDLHISWGKVRIELTTHAIKGLSPNDFIVAAKIDRLAEQLGVAQSI